MCLVSMCVSPMLLNLVVNAQDDVVLDEILDSAVEVPASSEAPIDITIADTSIKDPVVETTMDNSALDAVLNSAEVTTTTTISETTEGVSKELPKKSAEEMQAEADRMSANHSAPPRLNYSEIYGELMTSTMKFLLDNGKDIKEVSDKLKIYPSVVLGMVLFEQEKDSNFKFSEKWLKGILKGTSRADLKDYDKLVAKFEKKYKGLSDVISKHNLVRFDGDYDYYQGLIDSLMNVAFSYTGVPYVWGGKDPSGFDCSGFVSWVYAEALGIHIPSYTVSAEPYGEFVPLDSLQPGDLLFFGDYGQTDHIAIYIGGGQYIHSSTINGGVGVYHLSGYAPHFAKRIIN